jgi:hypothetical protein
MQVSATKAPNRERDEHRSTLPRKISEPAGIVAVNVARLLLADGTTTGFSLWAGPYRDLICCRKKLRDGQQRWQKCDFLAEIDDPSVSHLCH